MQRYKKKNNYVFFVLKISYFTIKNLICALSLFIIYQLKR
jgi:hypothetical protein